METLRAAYAVAQSNDGAPGSDGVTFKAIEEQVALKLIVEPIFEADFQLGSFGYRPKRTAHQTLGRVADAIALGKTHVIDLDLKSYFDGVRRHLLLAKAWDLGHIDTRRPAPLSSFGNSANNDPHGIPSQATVSASTNPHHEGRGQ